MWNSACCQICPVTVILHSVSDDTVGVAFDIHLVAPDGNDRVYLSKTAVFVSNSHIEKAPVIRISGSRPEGTYQLYVTWDGCESVRFEFEKLGSEMVVRQSESVALLGNYPNPFNPSTRIYYSLEEDAHVTIRIYNILGQLVRTLVDDAQHQGDHSTSWNGKSDVGLKVVSGVYIYAFTAGRFAATKRILFLK